MAQKLEKQAVLKQMTGGRSTLTAKEKSILREKGQSDIIHGSKFAPAKLEKMKETLEEAGTIRTSQRWGQIRQRVERKMAEEAKAVAEERKEANIRVSKTREALKVGQRAEKGGAVSSVFGGKVKTSALTPQAKPGRPETTTSILRKPEAAKPAEEKKPPEPIDLAID